MRRRYWFWSAVLAMSSALVAGCGGVSWSARTPPRGRLANDWPADKLAEAHAHYAAGVIAEMNDEPQAALQEYYQAAFQDPDNEPLLLEVSRRFLQNKQPEKALQLLTRAAARPTAS